MTRITHTVPIQGCATIQRAPVWQVCILAIPPYIAWRVYTR